ncbi:hypothetical protein [Clostridium baratii]|uniref:hypothetical protein n=1 Tax=Clostridium baratii TaxID=1561 RepID=UPI00290A97EA|nr:hypothetical protein [Clostridium baratii]MDU4910906.1 hypothetical protein [Clostridium baratii]
MQIKNKNYKINYVEQKYSKEDAYKTLDIINMWIGNVDSKISYSLTFIGVLLGFFITTSKPINISQVVDKIIKKIGQISRDGIHTSLNSIELKEIISVIILILIFIFIITASVACIYLYKGIKGRIDSDIYNQDGVVIKSNIFWDSISNQQYRDFYKNIKVLDESDLIRDISSQIFINSKICTEKFKNYNKGVDYIVISVIIFFMYTIIGYIFI